MAPLPNIATKTHTQKALDDMVRTLTWRFVWIFGGGAMILLLLLRL